MNLSVIIVSFNTKKLLGRCLASIKEASRTIKDLEIIVVDNGSTDGSIEEVESIKKEKGIKIELIKNSQNLGFSRAVNKALKQSRGQVLLLLNSDTQVKTGCLKNLLEFEKKVRPALIGLKMLNPDGSVQGSVFNLPTAKRAVEEFWLWNKGKFSKFAPPGNKPLVAEAVSGGALAISKEVIQKIGFFDERYFMYYEDLEYCRRAQKAGLKVWYLPKAQIIHEHGASGIDNQGNQQKRLISSSKIYHGVIVHYLINIIIRLGRIFKNR